MTVLITDINGAPHKGDIIFLDPIGDILCLQLMRPQLVAASLGIAVEEPAQLDAKHYSEAIEPVGSIQQAGRLVAAKLTPAVADRLRQKESGLNQFPRSLIDLANDRLTGAKESLKRDREDTDPPEHLLPIAMATCFFWTEIAGYPGGLQEWIDKIQLVDIAEFVPGPGMSEISRNHQLYRDLLDLLSERKCLFLFGGQRSGATTFRGQLDRYMNRMADMVGHVADFSPAAWHRIFRWRKRWIDERPAEEKLPNEDHILPLKSLLCGAAYSIYVLIRNSVATEGPLDEWAGTDFRNRPTSFADRYLDARRSGRAQEWQVVEDFFAFCSKMIEVTNFDQGLSIFFPFSSLGRAFSTRIMSQLSASLDRSAASDGFEPLVNNAATQLKKGMRDFGLRSSYRAEARVAILIFTSDASLLLGAPDDDNFSRHSTVVLPPLSPREIALHLFKFAALHSLQRDADLFAVSEDLIKATSGSPWLVRIVLDVTTLLLSDSPQRPLRSSIIAAIEHLETVLRSGEYEAADGLPIFAVDELRLYANEVKEMLGRHDASRDAKILADWRAPRHPGFDLAKVRTRLTSWLSSGLIFLDSPEQGVPILEAFRRSPQLTPRPAGRLQLAFLEGLERTRRQAFEDEKLASSVGVTT